MAEFTPRLQPHPRERDEGEEEQPSSNEAESTEEEVEDTSDDAHEVEDHHPAPEPRERLDE